MSDRSAIEWTDASWNPVRARNIKTGKVGWHCEHATTGCEFCYSEGFNKRLGTGLPFKPGHRKDVELFLDQDMLTQPLRWKKPRKIFVCSMTDLFAEFVPDEWIDKVFAVMALSPQHTFQLLTKRAKRMRDYMLERWQPAPARRLDLGGGDVLDIPAETEGDDRCDRVAETLDSLIDDLRLQKRFRDTENDAHWTTDGNPICKDFAWPLPNVWLGVSAERQEEADERIPRLLETPAAVRFISAEPLLGPINLTSINHRGVVSGHSSLHDRGMGKLDWVIVGGESGPKARPMHPDWARGLRDQCKAARAPLFFKQWGQWKPLDQFDSQVINSAGTHAVIREDGRFTIDTDIADPPRAVFTFKMGKKAAGRLLDGELHNAMPERSA